MRFLSILALAASVAGTIYGATHMSDLSVRLIIASTIIGVLGVIPTAIADDRERQREKD